MQQPEEFFTVSDDKKIPPPPPDDYTKTTPNVNIPDPAGSSDWDKTNYNIPVQGSGYGADDWGKTVTNIKPINTDQQDFGKTMYPGARNVPEADWGMTQANINIRESDFGSAPEDYGGGEHVADKTTPYFRLPEAERAKYEKIPPTPAEQAEQQRKEKEAQGGVPGWFWVAAGLMTMFFFAVGLLIVVYFLIMPGPSYEVTVKAPLGSDIYIDEVAWSLTSEDGLYKLPVLAGGQHRLRAEHPTQECVPRDINLQGGVNPETIVMQCKAKRVDPGEDCTKINPGEEDKAERCYYAALAALPDQFSVDDLVKALNLLVVNFASDSFEVPRVRLEALRKGAEYIQKVPPSVVLEVGGHTDSQGGAAHNQKLSENRANAVKQKLVQFGVRNETLQTRGYGAAQPIDDNNTDIGRYHNRRIQYMVLKR